MTIKLGVEVFKVYLIGRLFVIQTDHRSLKCLNQYKVGVLSENHKLL